MAELNGGDSRPRPDPTSLTTQALNAAIDSLTEQVNVQFAHVEKLLEVSERHRVELKQDANDALKAAMVAAQEGILVAMTAAKEAGAKTETHFGKEIDALNKQIDEMRLTLAERIDDNKERIGDVRSAVEGIQARQQGGTAAVVERRAGISNIGTLVGIVGGVLAVVIVVVTLIVASQ